MVDVRKKVEEITPEITQMRVHIHENPELSMKEYNTCALLEDYVKKNVKYDRLKRVGETGLFFELKGTKPGNGPTIVFRGDIDALPIQEDEHMSPRSKVPGVMHACGHDVHGTINVGAAKILSEMKDQFSGSIYFFIQPAEEILQGAKLFLNDPEIDFDKIDAVAALHVSAELDAGTIGVRYGAILASADGIRIRINGKGGHGATPEVCVDAITAGAAVVQSLQTIVSRFTSPMDSVVVTVGSFHAGTRCNIIAQDAVLEGTLRAFDDNVHARLIEHFKRIITDVSAAYGCTAEIEINEVAGVVVNDEALCRIANECAAELVPPDRIQPQHPCMLGDDFASYRAIAPSCFVQVGMLAPEKNCCYAHHHGMFKVDEDVLPLCAAWMAAMAARAAAR